MDLQQNLKDAHETARKIVELFENFNNNSPCYTLVITTLNELEIDKKKKSQGFVSTVENSLGMYDGRFRIGAAVLDGSGSGFHKFEDQVDFEEGLKIKESIKNLELLEQKQKQRINNLKVGIEKSNDFALSGFIEENGKKVYFSYSENALKEILFKQKEIQVHLDCIDNPKFLTVYNEARNNHKDRSIKIE